MRSCYVDRGVAGSKEGFQDEDVVCGSRVCELLRFGAAETCTRCGENIKNWPR